MLSRFFVARAGGRKRGQYGRQVAKINSGVFALEDVKGDERTLIKVIKLRDEDRRAAQSCTERGIVGWSGACHWSTACACWTKSEPKCA